MIIYVIVYEEYENKFGRVEMLGDDKLAVKKEFKQKYPQFKFVDMYEKKKQK